VNFTVTASSTPATLAKPQATVTAEEFRFTGPSKLHDGELVRFENGGYLYHMVIALPVKNKAGAKAVTAALLTGKDNKAEKLVSGPPLQLMGWSARSRSSSRHARVTRPRGPRRVARPARGDDPDLAIQPEAVQPAHPRPPAGVCSENGEGGIRTRDGDFSPYSLSRRVPSATRPPLPSAPLSVNGFRESFAHASLAHGTMQDCDPPAAPWRGGRVVECAGLENQSPCKRTAGSNPAPSASSSTSIPEPAQVPGGGELSARGALGQSPPAWVHAGADGLERSPAPGKLRGQPTPAPERSPPHARESNYLESGEPAA
jgi:hypothetical protein